MPQDYFDDDTDDQVSNIRDAGEQNQETTEYQPIVAPKSAFMDAEYEVGDIIRMRVQAIHDDELVLVCDDSDESDETPAEEAAEQGQPAPAEGGGGPPTDYFD